MKLYKKILFLFILILPLFSAGQSKKVQKQQKKIAQTKELKTLEAERQYMKAVKHHHDIQTKDTHKMMKGNIKKTKKVYKGAKQDFFLKQWLKVFKRNKQRTKSNSGKKK